jgi:hypothetical protein
MDAENLYYKLLDVIKNETDCELNDEADEALCEVARLIAAVPTEADRDNDPHERYAMYTAVGNAAVHSAVTTLASAILSETIKRSVLDSEVEGMLKTVSIQGYGEVYDTEPRAEVRHQINKVCAVVGWKGLDEL